MQTAFFMESAYCKKCGKGTSVNLFCNNEILMLFLGCFLNTIFLTLLWRTITCLHARPFPPTDDEAARAGKILCHRKTFLHKCGKNKYLSLYSGHELLRTFIYNDYCIVPVRGINDDNRATNIATLFQQAQERSIRVRNSHAGRDMDTLQGRILPLCHSLSHVRY